MASGTGPHIFETAPSGPVPSSVDRADRYLSADADAAELEPILQMKIFGSRAEGATWAAEQLGAEFRTLLVHDAGNLTLVLEK